MSICVDTGTLSPSQFDSTQMLWIYNGLDCCVTDEVHGEIAPQLLGRPNAQTVYDFERAMQAPALEMMMRGFRIDMFKRNERLAELRKDWVKLENLLNEYGFAVWNSGINANSPAQLKELFYKTLGIPEIYKYEKGQKKVSTNREALEKIQAYFYARPIAAAILAARDVSKQIGVLNSGIDPDRRMRASYNVAGTETGRWSSSGNAFGTGTNLQNITPHLRDIFIADPGYRLCYIDLEQAESRLVGLLVWWLLGDPTYLDACESGDLHTTVARMVWPNLAWTGDAKRDKQVAEQPFYRQFSYRDMAKRGGHGTNYYGTPRTMAMHLKLVTKIMEDFQERYCGKTGAFPGIRRWHTKVAELLQTEGRLVTPLGRERHFLGRLTDDSTLREAIAHVPQSTIGDLLNLGLWRLWKHCGTEVQVLAQVHDAVVFQYPEELHHKIPYYQSLISTPITLRGRTMTIPTEAMTGFNWGKFDKKNPDKNPDGLQVWSPDDKRTRKADSQMSMLDRRFQGSGK